MRLSAELKQAWVGALNANTSPWIAFGIDASLPLGSDRVAGMAALIDWRVHGQVSLLVKEGLDANSFCLFPLPGGAQNFLLYNYDATPDAKAFAERAKKLGAISLTLAETTFPKDFLPKLKQALEKQQIRVTKLEPDS